jgi:Type III restriction enzyme, res subunit
MYLIAIEKGQVVFYDVAFVEVQPAVKGQRATIRLRKLTGASNPLGGISPSAKLYAIPTPWWGSDSSDRVSKGMFDEDWTRYVLKMATGVGKTKVMSLLMAWCYFHRRFDGAKAFFEDPILPPNGHEGRNWPDDCQLTVHIQDEIGLV